MGELFAMEIEPEVRDWLEALPAKHFLRSTNMSAYSPNKQTR